ncbi:MAG: pyridoxamine 5'-phosphate oxidase family protein [Chloroflexota bacterium]|nr:pyridoxamine 5'-phosphate oxidase family protein [Chloroflexota bacterium]
MKWSDVAAAAPELTATGEFALTRNGLCIVATLRADGSPRVSFVEATFVDGHLLLAMMRRSAKALDLLRDPRISVHNAVCTNLGTEQEYKVRGRATDVSDPVLRQHFSAIRGRVWGNRRFHLFAVDLESVGLITYAGGEQRVTVWPSGKQAARRY